MSKATVLRILTALAATLTTLASFGAIVDYLPAHYAGIAAIFLVGCLATKEWVVVMGDLADDGERNGSFDGSAPKTDEAKAHPNPSVLRQWFVWPLLLCLGLASCQIAQMSGRQLTYAQAGVAAARIGLEIAVMSLQEKLADPDAPNWQIGAAAATVSEARRALDRAEAGLTAAQLRQAEAASILPETSSAKAPVNVLLPYLTP